MRLKSLTTLNPLLLIAVCLALGATLWWSERAMERPYLLMARYLGLSQHFQHQAAENIHLLWQPCPDMPRRWAASWRFG